MKPSPINPHHDPRVRQQALIALEVAHVLIPAKAVLPRIHGVTVEGLVQRSGETCLLGVRHLLFA